MRVELTTDALERLIGGETEIELHLRQQVVDEFGKKHLKSLLNDATWKLAYESWKGDVAKEVAECIKAMNYTKERDVRDQVNSARVQVQAEFDRMVREMMDAAIKQLEVSLSRYVEREVKQRVEKQMNDQVVALVTAKLNLAIHLLKGTVS